MIAMLMCQLGGFACPLTEIIKLGPAGLAASGGLDIDYIGRVEREYPLDALACHNPSDRKRRINSMAFAGDYSPRKYADSLLVAFLYPAGNVHQVPDFKMRNILLQAFAFN